MMYSHIVVFFIRAALTHLYSPLLHILIFGVVQTYCQDSTNLCVIWIYFPHMLFVCEFVDICNLSLTYKHFNCGI